MSANELKEREREELGKSSWGGRGLLSRGTTRVKSGNGSGEK